MTTEITPLEQSTIGHYRLVRKLGQGGMSIVYEGFDERLQRHVAIKVLHPFLAQNHEYTTRFLREAQAVARLTHPNIVQIYDIGSLSTAEHQLYLVSELVVGVTLKEWIDRTPLLEIPEFAAFIISKIAQALDHAHQRGIIHRDLKQENIMITRDGHVKLMDFGIASMSNEENLTQAGTLLGSLSHLAPEIIKGEKATTQSDIYALSTIFFWMLTKKLPFDAASPHALLKAIVDTEPQKIQRLSPYVSDKLALVVEKGMNKQPHGRFSSAQQLINALDHALKEYGIHIDEKYGLEVLSHKVSPAQLKTHVLDQVMHKKQWYEQQKMDGLALLLQSRLDASPRPQLSSSCKRKTWISSLVVLILGGIGLASFKRVVPPPAPLEDPIPKTEPLAKEDTVLVPISEKEREPPAPAEVAEQKPTSPKSELQEIQVVIWPFANVLVNGEVQAKNQKSITLKLPLGSHRLSFTHPYAATVEKMVKIDRIGEPVELSITLNKTKPAFLVVKCAIDANIAINGSFKGSSGKSLEKPIVIPLPDRTHAITEQVIIQRDGYEPVIEHVEFTAGQIKVLKVDLRPSAKKHAQ